MGCGAPINPQEQGDDVGLIIARDAVTLDDDREVEVTGAGVERIQP